MAKEIKHLVNVSKVPEGGFLVWATYRATPGDRGHCKAPSGGRIRCGPGTFAWPFLPAGRKSVPTKNRFPECGFTRTFGRIVLHRHNSLEAGRGVFRALPEGPVPDCG